MGGQCYDETQIQRYVQLVSKMGFEKTKLAAKTPIGSVYCMPIDAVTYRRWKLALCQLSYARIKVVKEKGFFL